MSQEEVPNLRFNRWTALHYAALRGNLEVVKELIGSGAFIDLYTLARYRDSDSEIVFERVQEQMGMEDKWESVLLFVMRERERCSEEVFKKELLRFLGGVKKKKYRRIYI